MAVPPPFPVVLPPGAPAEPTVIRPPGAAPRPPVRRPPPAVEIATARRKRLVRLLLVAIGGVAVAAMMIFLAISKFVETEPPPRPKKPLPPPVAVKPVQEGTLAPEPEPATTKPAAPEEPVPVRPRPVRQHPKSTALSTTATTDLAPGVTVTTEAVEAEVEASQAFRTFVADAKISGVFQGTPSRAFINGRLIRVGEVVDSSLGVRFESVDPATKTIVFKDTTGAKVARRY